MVFRWRCLLRKLRGKNKQVSLRHAERLDYCVFEIIPDLHVHRCIYIYVGGTFGVYFVRSVRTIICTIYIRFIYRHVHDSALGMY